MVTSTSSATAGTTAPSAATATQSATSSLLQSLGAGGGMNVAQLSSDLAAAQFASRNDRLASQTDQLNARISSASNLKGMLLNLSTSLGTRVRQGDLSSQPVVANGSVATASLSGAGQPGGSYTLEVDSLARAQTLASQAFTAATDPVGAGTLTLRFGTATSTDFQEDTSHAPVDIAIAAGGTLADVAAAINAAGAGVAAYVAQTVDGAQLVMKGAEGTANGFVLDATEDPANPGLSALAWSPGSASGGTLVATSQNASFKVDGLAMTASSNHVDTAIPGVTLNLTGANPGNPTVVSFQDSAPAITAAMQDLTDALNQVADELNTATDPKTGDLATDDGARALKRKFSSLSGTVIMPNAPAGTPRTLSDLGLRIQRDGTFQLDAQRLSAALSQNPDAVAAMFTNRLYGIYATIDGISRTASATRDTGSLAGSIDRYASRLQQVSKDQTSLADQQDALRARLATSLSAAQNIVSTSQSTLTFLQNQIAAWNKTDN